MEKKHYHVQITEKLGSQWSSMNSKCSRSDQQNICNSKRKITIVNKFGVLLCIAVQIQEAAHRWSSGNTVERVPESHAIQCWTIVTGQAQADFFYC